MGHVQTWVAIALGLEAACDAQKRAVSLGSRVVQVCPPLALYPASEQKLCEQKRPCAPGLSHMLKGDEKR